MRAHFCHLISAVGSVVYLVVPTCKYENLETGSHQVLADTLTIFQLEPLVRLFSQFFIVLRSHLKTHHLMY